MLAVNYTNLRDNMKKYMDIFETHGMGKILCRPRERGTAECIIHDLKDKSIYAPASLNGTV